MLDTESAFHHGEGGGQAAALEDPLECQASFPGRPSRLPQDDTDLAMAEVEQMLHRRLHATGVIREGATRMERLGHVAIHDDDRGLEAPEQAHRRLVILVGERQDESIHAALFQHVQVGQLDLGVAERVRQQDRVAGLLQDRLGTLDDVRKQRIGDVADDEPDRQRLATSHALRQQVGLVVQFLHRGEHALAHRATHIRMAREHPRDR